MSRIGKLPVAVPKGVQVTLGENNTVSVKGPKGTLSQKIHKDMEVRLEEGQVVVTRPSDQKEHRALHGLSRSLIANMVEGVSNGFKKNLEIVGVGYRATKQGKKLVLNVGYSHPVEIQETDGLEFEVPAPTKISVKGIDKQAVGEMAANIRRVRPPEPYKGKGIRYENEYVRRKEGKTAK
ncbi:MAG: 50S ribosomal protein L6 [Christensenellales bacterium]|nr:50S ribosomal protein L6 [Clostridiales bacterium]